MTNSGVCHNAGEVVLNRDLEGWPTQNYRESETAKAIEK